MNKKSKIILLLIYLIAFVITCLGTTMAFFAINDTQKVIAESEVKSATETSTLYTTGEPLSIIATPSNFNEYLKESLTDKTELIASLKKGTNTKEVIKKYNVEINLEENTMQYSTLAQTAEIVLTIIDPNGKEIDTLGDLTGKTGSYMAAENYVLKSTSDEEVKHVWQIILTFVNLNNSQDINMGNGLKGYARINPVEENSNELQKS